MKKKSKLEYKEIYIELFDCYFTFVYSSREDQKKFITKRYPGLSYDEPNAFGFCTSFDGHTILWLSNELKKGSFAYTKTLIHESVHASWLIQDEIGRTFNEEIQEPQAYLVEYIFAKCYK